MRAKRNILTDLLIAAVISAVVWTGSAFCPWGSADAGKPQSSFEYKVYVDNSEYRKELKDKMYDVYMNVGSRMEDDLTMPIPGLVSTQVISGGKTVSSSDYVPQGLCRAGDYLLVTAYEAKKENNSVIYVIDTNRSELISTLTLPNKYHLGGIAFDGENIWMTGNTSDKYQGEPFVQYMKYEKFLSLLRDNISSVKEKDISDPVTISNKPSFLAYDNGVLWVGTYVGSRGSSEGYMYGYRIVRRDGTTGLNTLMYSVIAGIDSSAQGADFDGKYLYVSSSYNAMLLGLKTSFVTKYDVSGLSRGTDTLYVSGREVSRIEVPKMNEEILVEGQAVYINFESGAECWKNYSLITDRILAVRKSLWRLPL